MNTSEVTELYDRKIRAIRKTAYIRFDLAERLQIINYINLITSLILTTYLSGWTVFIAFFPNALGAADVILYLTLQ